MSENDYKISNGVVYPPPPTLASNEEFAAGTSTTASPSVKQVTDKFATHTDVTTATDGLASEDYVDRHLLNAVPAGTIIVWSGETPPTGFFKNDGSAISRTTYAKLYNVIGTRFGNGDGSTTFNLPTQTRTLVETMVNGVSFYNYYSDGWLEQGGTVLTGNSSAVTTVTFFKPYLNANYNVQATCNTPSVQWAQMVDLQIVNKTTSTFGIAANPSSNSNNWFAQGYAAIPALKKYECTKY